MRGCKLFLVHELYDCIWTNLSGGVGFGGAEKGSKTPIESDNCRYVSRRSSVKHAA